MPDINPAFSYIQLHHHGKIPTREWKDDKRVLPSQAREWIAQGFNLGVRTDRQSSCWVVDVDVDAEGRPSEEWLRLMEEHGGMPATFMVRTPSGGVHYYLRFPEGIDVRNDQGKVIAKGVDIRGIGGYVVAPGMYAAYNKHGIDYAGTYDVISDAPIAPTPDWIADLFRVREEKAAEKAAARVNVEATPKAEVIDDDTDQAARAELNQLFALVEQLTALPEGQSMEILGEERGWERGAGFFTLACKIIEVARWPHTTVTVDQAQQAWAQRVPQKYAIHDWKNALDSAGPTWEYGDRHFMAVDLFEGLRSVGGGEASFVSSTGEAEIVEADDVVDFFDQPIGFAANGLFKRAKGDEGEENSGQFLVDKARMAVNRRGQIVIDNSGVFWTYKGGVYVQGDDVVLDRLFHLLGDKFTKSHLENTRLAVKAKAPFLDLTQAPNPGIMNFTNGTLEWRVSDEVQPHTSKALTTTQFPYDWDPAAGCPKFDHWLQTMLEPEQVELAWKILGYMMLSGNPLQVAFMLYGKGSNGKSTFAHVIERLVGGGNTSAVPLKDFNQRFATSDMIGKIANIVGDIDADYMVSTAALKQVTGADAMQFERKNRNSFRATLWATCLFSCNQIPGTNDGSEGYAERWVPLHFKRKASDHRIEGFSEEGLWEEIPGIAAKAVRALRELPLHKGSERSNAFDLSSESAQEAVEEFREASNSFYAWVKKHTLPSETEVMKPKELWAAYKTATGSRVGGTNCPPKFAEVLTARYGEAKMRRGEYLGVQRNVRGWAITVTDGEDDISPQVDDFFAQVSA